MTTEGKPTVLIVGAGLGGLMLGALLEKIDIPYIIFERTSSIKSLGNAPPMYLTLFNLIITLTIWSPNHLDLPVLLLTALSHPL